MPFNLVFHTKYVLNPQGMHLNPEEVSLMAFALVFKILFTHVINLYVVIDSFYKSYLVANSETISYDKMFLVNITCG